MSHPYQGNDAPGQDDGWGRQGEQGQWGQQSEQGQWGQQSRPSRPGHDGQWGQPAPAYGSPSTAPGSPSTAYGQQAPSSHVPPGGYGQHGSSGPSPYSSPAPGRKRGLKRIIFGSIALVLGVLGLVLGGFLGVLIGTLISLTSIDSEDVTTVPAGSPVTVSASELYLVGTTDPTATCTASGSGATLSDQSGDLTFEKDGTTYHTVSQLSASSDGQATITCSGGEVAIASVGVGGTLLGLLIGVGIPALLGLLGLILLISGIVARVRSGRGK